MMDCCYLQEWPLARSRACLVWLAWGHTWQRGAAPAVQSVPYWVDDESVRSSMIASSPAPPPLLNRAEAATHKARVGLDELRPKTHPLLGAEPRLQLIQEGVPTRARPSPCMQRSPCAALTRPPRPYVQRSACACA